MTQGSRGSLRTVGIDDGYFPPSFKEGRLATLMVGVLCENIYPIDLGIKVVKVDGLDATSRAISVVKELSKKWGEIKAIFLDGVTFAGFNIINPSLMHDVLGYPIVTVFKHSLDLQKIRKALMNNFSDCRERYSIIKDVYEVSKEVRTGWRKLRISSYGLDPYVIAEIITDLQLTSPLPEPLRLADLIASGLTKESGILELLNEGRLD